MQDDSLKRHVPAGTRDYIPSECRRKRTLEAILRRVFAAAGYDEVETPLFEHYDVFTHESVPYVQEELLKFFGRDGRILAMRPDATGPIARMAATKLLRSQRVLRLFYIGNVYGVRGSGEQIESTQAGVELIGAEGIYADAEPVALAIRALLAMGVSSFSIEIGQVAYFRGLLAGCNLSDRQEERIRALINDKNSIELEYALSQLPLPASVCDALLELPGLFGGEEALRAAAADNAQCAEAVENLRAVLDVLRSYGLEQYVTVDLGLLHDFQYYSGLIFRGLAEGIGRPILSGGRYDGLLGEFGQDAPATGFAIRLTRLLRAMRALGGPADGDGPPPITLRFRPEEADRAASRAEQLRNCGLRVILGGPETAPGALDWNDPELEALLC